MSTHDDHMRAQMGVPPVHSDTSEQSMDSMVRLGDILVRVGCPSCHWDGNVHLYDIGDGPEWCCPQCDFCHPSNPVRGDDGMTNAERKMRAEMDRVMRERFSE